MNLRLAFRHHLGVWRMKRERARWDRARRHLAKAGKLLSKSHPETLFVQTSKSASVSRCYFEFAGPKVGLSVEKTFTVLSPEDSHGLLLQLAAACFVVEKQRAQMAPEILEMFP